MIHHGDCLDVMRSMDAESVDAVVCDPPYGLSFMGKEWDHGVPGVPFWAEALRVAKPGAHLVAFGGTRTYHRLTCAIEDAGWEIRDCLSYLYGSGFPKSHNGPWGGTALKPAHEPIILARKPLIGTVAKNVTEHGTGGLNIDGCRIGTEARINPGMSSLGVMHDDNWVPRKVETSVIGRWPANVCLDEEAARLLDEQSGELKSGFMAAGTIRNARTSVAMGRMTDNAASRDTFADTGGASRFFYCAKASRSEREAGLEGMDVRQISYMNTHGGDADKGETWSPIDGRTGEKRDRFAVKARNHHPTVKPLSLMRWLCRLVTPPKGLILDPFCGSGTTGCAAVQEGFAFVGIEKELEYVAIAEKRIAHWTPSPSLL